MRSLREYGLTAGTLGSTSAQTLMVALLPVLLAEYAPSAIWIGLVIGGEGLFALLVPYWVGHLSDHLPARWARRLGRRTLFLHATAPIMAGTLALTPFLEGYWMLAAAAFVFFAAFHGYLTPLWALMIDAVPERRRGRVHGVRGAFHAAGLGYGLVAGGLLFSIWPALPFLVGAALILVTTFATHVAARVDEAGVSASSGTGRGERRRTSWRTFMERPPVRWFLIANALWTGAVDGIRPYIFPFALVVLGISVADTSLVLLVLLAGIGIGTVLLGRLGDRYGRAKLLEAGALLTAVAMLAGVFVRDVTGALLLLLAAGLGAAALIALPYPLFASLAGERGIGRYTGLYILSMGAARVVAPILVGAAIDLGAAFLPAYRGYPWMWPIAGVMALASVHALRRAVREPRNAL
ncbi:MAG: MFS transporter [Gemmatimonadota bacterium]